jgi:uncharacterized protein YqeY
MSLKEVLEKSLREAMLSKNNVKRDTIRMALSSLKQLEKDSGKELVDQDVFGVIQKEIKTREETIAEARKANREEMIQPLLAEIEILKGYLPKEMSDDDLLNLVKSVISELSAETMKDMGKVMKESISRTEGAATNDRISKTARSLLQE